MMLSPGSKYRACTLLASSPGLLGEGLVHTACACAKIYREFSVKMSVKVGGYVHGKVLRKEYTDPSVDTPSSEYSCFQAHNRARKKANWIAIACWKLDSALPARQTPAKVSLSWYRAHVVSWLYEASTKRPNRACYCRGSLPWPSLQVNGRSSVAKLVV